MKSLLLLNCYLFLIGYSLASNVGQCDIDGIQNNDYIAGYTLNIDDTQVDISILETPYRGNLVITACTGTNGYFDITNNDTQFIIKTTPAFRNFDNDISKQPNSFYLVNLECTLSCVGISVLPIQIVVTDINTHPPEFSLQKYEYKIATPLMPLTDFTVYGDLGISVTDIDFSNQFVTFTVDPDEFSITTSTSTTSKQYGAVFSTRNVIQLIGNRTYTITATDSGTIPGPLSSTATFTLIVDESKSLDTPLFESTSYTFNYTVDGSTPILTANDGPITIATNKPTLVSHTTLTGTYQDYFTATLDQATGTISFDVSQILPTDTGSFIILTLSVFTDNIASTSIIVYIPSEVNEAPIFSSHYYTGSYSDLGSSVTLDDTITITSARNPNVSIAGDYADHFNIIYNEATRSCQISVESDLSGSEITSHSYISLLLTATVGENNDSAVLILSLPIYKLQFTKALYNASYNKNATVFVDSPIGFTADVTGANITMDGTYADNFVIKYTAETNQWSITVNIPLTNATLKTQEDIVLTLSAADYYGNTAQSVLTIYLPSTEAPTFSEAVYIANYTANGLDSTITLEQAIIISNIADQTGVTITLDSFTENLSVDYDSSANKWNLVLKLPLSNATLASRKEIIVTLTATEANNDNIGQAILIVSWSTLEAPTFSEVYYLGTYPENGTGAIVLETPISFTNVEYPTNVVISLDSYTENFGIAYSSGEWTITIKQNLDASILAKNSELVIVLTATETGNVNEGQSVLVLELPDDKRTLRFSSAYYLAEYPKNGTGIIEFESPITFTNVYDPTTIEISLDNFTNNFEIQYDNDKWYINIKNSLVDTILNENVELVLTMTATQTGNTIEDHAVLILTLSDIEAAPKFSEAYYVAEYPKSGSGVIEFERPITFLNVEDPNIVKISLDNYNSNFQVLYEAISNRWYINIVSSLDAIIVTKNAELVITLVAAETGVESTGKSALVLKLPTAVNGTAPKFSDAFYIASYPESGTGVIEFETPITFVNIDNPTDIKISLDNYAMNFEIIYDSYRWYINILSRLDDSVLYENVELVMTLIATDALTNKGESAMVLKLPTATNGTAPKFSKAYYIAVYPESGTGNIEFETPIEFINIDDPTKVIINLDNYGNNFNIVYESNKWHINIINSLDQAVLARNTELVMTITAKEDGNENVGESALLLKLPTSANGTAPRFSEAYYIAAYPETGQGVIEFETPIEFLNVNDPTTVTISLDNYINNFAIKYESNRWYINITSSLENTILYKNAEVVMTLFATETGNENSGETALVLKLPTAASGTSPKFSESYYIGEYPANGTGTIELETPIEFINVENLTSITISLDNYADNFEIKYETNRWYINIIRGLEETDLHKNAEIVMTLIATEIGETSEGKSALVLKLPTAVNGTAPKFSEAYYLAYYPQNGIGFIEFENPIDFTNVDDPTSVVISLSEYATYFDISYTNNRWYMSIKNNLEDTILNKNAELVMTLTATETGNNNAGYSALVLRLPAATNITAPKFSEAYYTADYPKNGQGILEFDNPIEFVNIEDPAAITISLDNYVDNFEIFYMSGSWHMNIKDSLENSILVRNAELVMTLIATETGSNIEGYSALVLRLPSTANETALEFEAAYYIAEYPESGAGTIEFENPIGFINVVDPTSVTITLDNYASNFEIIYTSSKWSINIKNALGDDVLNQYSELIITLAATETDIVKEGYSALVLKLPTAVDKTRPVFSEAYYIADYPENPGNIMEFENPITFKNVNDLSKVTITLDNYIDYFDITLESGTWVIRVKKSLEDSILNENDELVMTLIATETDKTNEGYSALVVKISKQIAPVFSKPYYVADYTFVNGTASVVFTDLINITNEEDLSRIYITVDDNYQGNFNIAYSSASNSWIMNVVKQLSDSILINNTDIVVAITATDSNNNLFGQSVIDLKLPSINTEASPKFSKTYYTAKYTISGDTALITFDTPLNITNREDLTYISISTDNYAENFRILYDVSSNAWIMNVVVNLDESILNAKIDLVMALTASEDSNNDIAQAALVITLPIVNNDEAPNFSRIYYSGEYNPDDTAVVLDNAIEITNKNNLTKVTISFDDNYRDNFEIVYDSNTSSWILNVKALLAQSFFSNSTDIILTLTATEEDNTNIGQAALILHLPLRETKLPPKFSLSHYSAKYVVDGNQATINLADVITIVNKEDLTAISVTLDSYNTNFHANYDLTLKQWQLSVTEPLLDDILNATTELVLTLVARETDNDNIGESTLILTLPPTNANITEEVILFSQVHYTANYSAVENSLTMIDNVKVIATVDTTNLTVSFKSEEYSDHFTINREGDNYIVVVKTALPSEILERQVSLVMTLVAEVDESSSYATLVINLPTRTTDVTIEFSETLYSGTYEIIDAKGNFKIEGTIHVETDEDDTNIESRLSSATGYDTYFQMSYSNNLVTVALNRDLPEDVLKQNSFIPLILTVGIKGTAATASAVLNVAIHYNVDENSTTIAFSSVLYNGKYDVTNGDPAFTVDEITIVTDEPDNNVEVSLTNDNGYGEYFQKSYSNKQVTIELAKDIPEIILQQNSFIPLILSVGVTGTAAKSSAVLNVDLNYNKRENTTSIEFSNVLYNAIYNIAEGESSMTIINPIKLVTDEDESKVEVKIINEYLNYFNVTHSDENVTVNPTKPLTADILNSTSVIPLILQAEITGTSALATAVLNIRIIYDDGKEVTGLLEFGTVLYTGEYSEDSDGKGELEINEPIKIVTDRDDSEIEASFSNNLAQQYNQYFKISYSSKSISVELATTLPSELVKNHTFIALTLTVGVRNTVVTSSAVLNIEFDRDRDNDDTKTCDSLTAYIAVIAILAVLLIACIAAALGFYFFRIRKGSYENLDNEGNGKVRFGKNSLRRTSYERNPNPIEGRRPTGFVFNPIGEDHVEAINSINNDSNIDLPNDVEKTRRKSVAFDDNVEKLQIDSVNDEDIVSDDSNNDKPEITHV